LYIFLLVSYLSAKCFIYFNIFFGPKHINTFSSIEFFLIQFYWKLL